MSKNDSGRPKASASSTDWSNLVAYRCPSCGENCINEHDTAAARYRRCRDCVSIPELDDDLERDDLLEAGDGDLDDRQAEDILRGAVGGAVRPSTAIGDAADRLAYRRGGP